jgi:hypothetical protein
LLIVSTSTPASNMLVAKLWRNVSTHCLPTRFGADCLSLSPVL